MKKTQKYLIIIVSLLLFAFASIPAYASQFGTEVAVIVRFIDYATEEEVYVGTRGTDSDGNSVLYASQIYDSYDDAYDVYSSMDGSNAPDASFQIDGGTKTSVTWYDGPALITYLDDNDEKHNVARIRSGHYYLESETSTWTADTTITVSDVEIPEGYTEVDESGIYTVTFGEENYNQVQSIINGSMEDTNEAIYIYVDVVISDGTVVEEAVTEESSDEAEETTENVTVESEEEKSSFPGFMIPVGIALVCAAAYIFYSQSKKNK